MVQNITSDFISCISLSSVQQLNRLYITSHPLFSIPKLHLHWCNQATGKLKGGQWYSFATTFIYTDATKQQGKWKEANDIGLLQLPITFTLRKIKFCHHFHLHWCNKATDILKTWLKTLHQILIHNFHIHQCNNSPYCKWEVIPFFQSQNLIYTDATKQQANWKEAKDIVLLQLPFTLMQQSNRQIEKRLMI